MSMLQEYSSIHEYSNANKHKRANETIKDESKEHNTEQKKIQRITHMIPFT